MKSLKLFIVTLMIYCTTNTQIRSYFVVFFSHSNLIRKFTVKRSQMFVFNPNTLEDIEQENSDALPVVMILIYSSFDCHFHYEKP